MKNLHWWNNPNDFRYRRMALWLGIGALIIWVICLAFFQTDRWLSTDPAYTFFRVLNCEPLFYDRYANLLQVIPGKLAVWAGASAATVLTCLNFGLVLLLIPVLLIQGRNPFAVLWLPMAFFSVSALAFFIGYNELALSVIAFAALMVHQQKNALPGNLFTLILCTVMLMAHPAGIAFVPVLALYFFRNGQAKRPALYILLFVAAVYLLRLLILPVNNYDSGVMARLTEKGFWKNIGDSYFLFYFSGKYLFWFPVLLSLIVSLFLWIGNDKRSAIFVLVSVLAVFVICTISFYTGDADQVMEKYMQILSISGYSSIFYLNPKKLSVVMPAVLIISAGLFLAGIPARAAHWKNHTSAIFNAEKHYQQRRIYKVLVADSQLIDFGYSTWALPYETMLASALKNQKYSVNVKPLETENISQYKELFPDSTFANAPFLPPFSVKKLNPAYFRQPEGPYYLDAAPVNSWLKNR